MQTGGWADKLGNRYEGRWTAQQLLRLLDGRVQAVQLESVTEEHVDLFVTNCDGTIEAHQCKRKMHRNGWRIMAVVRGGVVGSLQAYLGSHQGGRFVFVANQPATDLMRLIDRARSSPDLPAFVSPLDGTQDHRAWATW